MSREYLRRLLVKAELVTGSPLHVGGGVEDPGTDLPLSRDGSGRFYVPGTSLAGVMREWAERHLSGVDHLSFWGFAPPGRKGGSAARIEVEDSVVRLPGGTGPLLRDNVAIDREYGAAAAGTKYDRAVLPVGTVVPLQFSVGLLEAEARADRAVVAHLLGALRSGAITLGAAGSRGLGRIALTNPTVQEQTLTTRDGILAAAAHPESGRPIEVDEWEGWSKGLKADPGGRVTVEVDWQPIGPLMVQSGIVGLAVDSLPLVEPVGIEVSPVLPGSSIKGALRAAAERIMRTLLNAGDQPWRDVPIRQRLLEQTDGPALIDWVFGARKPRAAEEEAAPAAPPGAEAAAPGPGEGGEPRAPEDRDRAPLPGRGALKVEDCLLAENERWAPTAWAGVVDEGAREQLASRADKLPGEVQVAYHVAIDRWTGGAADQLLYDVLEPHGQKWQPLRLTLDADRLGTEAVLPSVALLLLVLDELADGRLPLGFAVNRGMGSVEISRVQLTADGVEGWPAEIDLVRPEGSRWWSVLEEIPAEVRSNLTKPWAEWLAQRETG